MEDSHSLPNSDSNSEHSLCDNASTVLADGRSCGGSSNGAKYKLMSPGKLPISKPTCITVPPALSPTSFHESPVLLSNIKAEPSPTTGSFHKPPSMQAFGETVALSPKKNSTSGDNVDERAPSSFEFKFHTGSAYASGSSSLMIPAGLNRNGPFNQIPDERISQSPAHSADQKDSMSSVTADRTSDDGYNWRKYGQKLVKGSEFPRSYYKCTYPNCEVKKIFERSPSGQITDLVYKGSHDHPKPQAAHRHNPVALMSIQEQKMDKDSSFNGQNDNLNTNSMGPNVSPALSPLQANEEGLEGSGSQIRGVDDDIDEDDPFSKRRKMEDGLDLTPVIKPIREPRVVVQTVSEVDILDDGYRWRKYGQKVVRGNPNPRSYYKCTNAECPVRKHVERASHDPKAVITTYEGKHNHDVPTSRNSNHEFTGTASHSGNSNIRTEEGGSVSLDLGVGISRVDKNRANEQAHTLDAEAARNQIAPSNSRMMVIQASQISACYGIVKDGLILYGGRENHVEGHNNFQTLHIHPSNQCPPNLGRILMGP